MKQKRVVITGAGGFIGYHLTNYLTTAGCVVTGIDVKEPEYGRSSARTFHIGDLRDWSIARKLLVDADELYMLAADMGGVGYINTVNADIVRNNSLINLNSLQAAAENNIPKVFFASSACVYPEFKQEKLNITGLRETDAIPAQPDTPYGWEKLFTEQACLSFARDYQLEVRIARFHNIYGPMGTFEGGREKSPAAICRKVALAKDTDTIEIWGDGEQQRSYCYITDCVNGINQLMNSSYSLPINIGSDRLVSINQMTQMVSAIAGKHITVRHDVSKPQGVRSRNADISLAKSTLKWQPEVSLEDGLAQTYQWILEQLRKQ